MINCDPLNKNFFALCDDFAALSSLEQTPCDGCNEKNWLGDDLIKHCVLCGSEFTYLLRRHHCRHCGLIFCGGCSSNRTVIGQSVVRICDACASILIPQVPERSTKGLDNWQMQQSESVKKLVKSSRNVGFSFFYSLMESDCKDVHRNAIQTLCKLFSMYAPFMIEDGTEKMLAHSLNCDCGMKELSLDLFISMLLVNKNYVIRKDIFNEDLINGFMNSESIGLRRTCARLLYSLASNGNLLMTPDVIPLLKLNLNDKWIVAYLLGIIAIQVGGCSNPNDILDNKSLDKKQYQNSKILIPILMDQFNDKSTTIASKYFSSIIFEKISQFSEDSNSLIKYDFNNLIKCINMFEPSSSNDNKPDIIISINLMLTILNIWKNFNGSQDEGTVFLSNVHMIIYEILSIKNTDFDNSKLSILQMICFKILETISSFGDVLRIMIKSQQMIDFLTEYSNGHTSFCERAKRTLEELQKE